MYTTLGAPVGRLRSHRPRRRRRAPVATDHPGEFVVHSHCQLRSPRGAPRLRVPASRSSDPATSSTGVNAFQSPVVPALESNATRPNVSLASYLPVCSDAHLPEHERVVDRAHGVDGLGPRRVVQGLARLLGDGLEEQDVAARVLDRRPDLRALAVGPRLDVLRGDDLLARRLLVGLHALLHDRGLEAFLRALALDADQPLVGIGVDPGGHRVLTTRLRGRGLVGDQRRLRERVLQHGDVGLRHDHLADEDERVDVLALPLLDEALELRLRGRRVGTGDVEHRAGALLHLHLLQRRRHECRRRGPCCPAA